MLNKMYKFTEIQTKIDNLEKTVAKLTVVIEKLSKTTERMDNHITFIESCYNGLWFPLNFIKNNVNKYLGIPLVDLPKLLNT